MYNVLFDLLMHMSILCREAADNIVADVVVVGEWQIIIE